MANRMLCKHILAHTRTDTHRHVEPPLRFAPVIQCDQKTNILIRPAWGSRHEQSRSRRRRRFRRRRRAVQGECARWNEYWNMYYANRIRIRIHTDDPNTDVDVGSLSLLSVSGLAVRYESLGATFGSVLCMHKWRARGNRCQDANGYEQEKPTHLVDFV